MADITIVVCLPAGPTVPYSAQHPSLTTSQCVPCLDTSWPNICGMSFISGCVSAADVFPLPRINTGYYIWLKKKLTCFVSEDQENLETVLNHLVVGTVVSLN